MELVLVVRAAVPPAGGFDAVRDELVTCGVTSGYATDPGAFASGVLPREARVHVGDRPSLADLAAGSPGQTVAVICEPAEVDAYVADVLAVDGDRLDPPRAWSVTRVRISSQGHRNVMSYNDDSHLFPATQEARASA